MVESSPHVLKALKANLHKLGAEQVDLVAMDALKFLDSDKNRFDVIFLDPPYRLGLLPKLLSSLHLHLAQGGVVYLENDTSCALDANWVTWRKGQAGNVHYQLLKFKKDG